jgi:LPXTG-motif cell wall-anchored protein
VSRSNVIVTITVSGFVILAALGMWLRRRR